MKEKNHKRLIWIVPFIIIILLVVSVKSNTYFQSLFSSPKPTSTPTSPSPGDDIYIPNPSNQNGDELIAKSKKDLSQALNIKEDKIEVKKVEKTDWSDGSLGCPKPGFMYTQAIVPGYLITLEAQGKEYNYHTSSEEVLLCR